MKKLAALVLALSACATPQEAEKQSEEKPVVIAHYQGNRETCGLDVAEQRLLKGARIDLTEFCAFGDQYNFQERVILIQEGYHPVDVNDYDGRFVLGDVIQLAEGKILAEHANTADPRYSGFAIRRMWEEGIADHSYAYATHFDTGDIDYLAVKGIPPRLANRYPVECSGKDVLDLVRMFIEPSDRIICGTKRRKEK